MEKKVVVKTGRTGMDISKLYGIPCIPDSMGCYKKHDPGVFLEKQRTYLKTLGYGVKRCFP